MDELTYGIDQIQTQAIKDLEAAGCMGSTCEAAPAIPVTPVTPVIDPLAPVVKIVDTEADEPIVFVVENDDAPDDYFVDPADVPDFDVHVTEPTDPNDTVIVILIDEEGTEHTTKVVYVTEDTDKPSIVVVDNGDDTSTTYVVDTKDPENPVVILIPEPEPVVIPTDDQEMPSEEDTNGSFAPTFDDEGNVDGTEDGDGNVLPLNPVTPIVVPVDDNQEQPSVPTPEVVDIVDGGADEPTAYVVPGTDGADDTYFVDPAGTVDPEIKVVEVPEDEPIIVVDGEVVPVIPIGPEESHPEVINVVDPETN